METAFGQVTPSPQSILTGKVWVWVEVLPSPVTKDAVVKSIPPNRTHIAGSTGLGMKNKAFVSHLAGGGGV